jgi:hypothetical protein
MISESKKCSKINKVPCCKNKQSLSRLANTNYINCKRLTYEVKSFFLPHIKVKTTNHVWKVKIEEDLLQLSTIQFIRDCSNREAFLSVFV